MLTVTTRNDGKIRPLLGLRARAHGPSDPGQNHHGIDAFGPIFNLLDITSEGRGVFLTELAH